MSAMLVLIFFYFVPMGLSRKMIPFPRGVALGYNYFAPPGPMLESNLTGGGGRTGLNKYHAPQGLDILRFAQNDNNRSHVILRRPAIVFPIWHTPSGR
jgi:hypothetical protein